MRITNKIKALFVLWVVLLIITVGVSVPTIVENGYIDQGLFYCAVSNSFSDINWYSLLFVVFAASTGALAVILRLLLKDSERSLRSAIKLCTCILIVYVTIVFFNTSSWFPEFYTAKGISFNIIAILIISSIIAVIPLPIKRISSILTGMNTIIPVLIAVFLYLLPAVYVYRGRSDSRYNVLIITVDSMRAQNLSMNGYSRETSRNLDEFAGECVNFRNAYSQSSFTPPSHSSIFTSRFVSNHGVLDWNKLDDHAVTMAEVFANEGYRTAAFVNLSLLSEQNLGQGFQTNVESFLNLKNCLTERIFYKMKKRAVDFFSGREINEMFLDWVGGGGRTPFFAWLHYWDVHRPYAQDERYELVFSDGKYKSRKIGRDLKYYNLRKKNIEKMGLTEADLEFIADRYDASIYTFDLQFKELIEGLRKAGVYDNTLIIVTADHGESLLERDEMYFVHDPFLYNEVIHVPLLMKIPGSAVRKEVSEPVMLVDIFPTLLDYFDLTDRYSIRSDGVALDLSESADRPPPHREIVSECFGWRYKRAIIINGIKYIYDFKEDTYEIYDLEKSEFTEISVPENELYSNLAKLKNGLDDVFAILGKDEDKDADQLERLKQLGYVE